MPRDSATIGLPGDIENQVGLDASHSEMCRFEPSLQADMKNYQWVKRNIKGLYLGALEKQGETLPNAPRHQLEDRLAALAAWEGNRPNHV